MRFSTISAVLCGLAIVPGVVSQDSPENGPRMKIYRIGNEWVCDRQRNDFCFPTCVDSEDGELKVGADGVTICEVIAVANIAEVPSSPTSTSAPSSTTSLFLGTTMASGPPDLGTVDDPSLLSAGGSNVSQIAGGVVGGVLGLALLGGLIFFLKRRKRNREKPSAHHESAVIADKSRALSPVSHTSPTYGGVGAAVVSELAAPARQFTDPEFANPPPSQQPVVPIAPVHTPQQQAVHSPGSPTQL